MRAAAASPEPLLRPTRRSKDGLQPVHFEFKRYTRRRSSGDRAAAQQAYIERPEAVEQVTLELLATTGLYPAENFFVQVRSETALASFGTLASSAESRRAFWRGVEKLEKVDGILQYRIIAELPHEVSAGARLRIKADFCLNQLAARGYPFWASAHQPDLRNDLRNYHAHILFYGRPGRRVDGSWVFKAEVPGFNEDDCRLLTGIYPWGIERPRDRIKRLDQQISQSRDSDVVHVWQAQRMEAANIKEQVRLLRREAGRNSINTKSRQRFPWGTESPESRRKRLTKQLGRGVIAADDRSSWTAQLAQVTEWVSANPGAAATPPPAASLAAHDVGFILALRTAWCEACNTELEREGFKKRYWPGSYRSLGIDAVPSQHLGTRRAALEATGVATSVGRANDKRARDDLRARGMKEEAIDTLAERETLTRRRRNADHEVEEAIKARRDDRVAAWKMEQSRVNDLLRKEAQRSTEQPAVNHQPRQNEIKADDHLRPILVERPPTSPVVLDKDDGSRPIRLEAVDPADIRPATPPVSAASPASRSVKKEVVPLRSEPSSAETPESTPSLGHPPGNNAAQILPGAAGQEIKLADRTTVKVQAAAPETPEQSRHDVVPPAEIKPEAAAPKAGIRIETAATIIRFPATASPRMTGGSPPSGVKAPGSGNQARAPDIHADPSTSPSPVLSARADDVARSATVPHHIKAPPAAADVVIDRGHRTGGALPLPVPSSQSECTSPARADVVGSEACPTDDRAVRGVSAHAAMPRTGSTPTPVAAPTSLPDAPIVAPAKHGPATATQVTGTASLAAESRPILVNMSREDTGHAVRDRDERRHSRGSSGSVDLSKAVSLSPDEPTAVVTALHEKLLAEPRSLIRLRCRSTLAALKATQDPRERVHLQRGLDLVGEVHARTHDWKRAPDVIRAIRLNSAVREIKTAAKAVIEAAGRLANAAPLFRQRVTDLAAEHDVFEFSAARTAEAVAAFDGLRRKDPGVADAMASLGCAMTGVEPAVRLACTVAKENRGISPPYWMEISAIKASVRAATAWIPPEPGSLTTIADQATALLDVRAMPPGREAMAILGTARPGPEAAQKRERVNALWSDAEYAYDRARSLTGHSMPSPKEREAGFTEITGHLTEAAERVINAVDSLAAAHPHLRKAALADRWEPRLSEELFATLCRTTPDLMRLHAAVVEGVASLETTATGAVKRAAALGGFPQAVRLTISRLAHRVKNVVCWLPSLPREAKSLYSRVERALDVTRMPADRSVMANVREYAIETEWERDQDMLQRSSQDAAAQAAERGMGSGTASVARA
ncbi:MobA/MobL family protein [Roseomonas harenae]|uniref:MobA/MobL family protein n=1 Tax=Muricoccus harenae TaxID=2692566 RepID=UPI00133152DD|nr:MobA/MobL family protein [Roseomonas harenae]